MDFKWLEDFISVANTRNFSKSANQRNVTQPTFSRRIRSLEEWLGASLIDRSVYPATLTDAGHAFRETAEEAVQGLYMARADIRSEQAAQRAAVSFSALHSIALTFFPSWIGDLKATLGLGATRMFVGNLHECVETFVNGNCDFLICYSHDTLPIPLDAARFPSVVLARDRLIPVSAANDDGTPVYSLSASSTEKIPYLSNTSEAFLGPVVEKLIVSKRLDQVLEVVHEDPMSESLKRMALEGLGVSWLPQSIAASELESGRLVRCGDKTLDIDLEITLYHSVDRSRAKVMQLWSYVSSNALNGRQS